MGKLNIPFIFGPVSGGEVIPHSLRKSFDFKNKLREFFRDLANFLPQVDPFLWQTFRKAKKIYITSEQTQNLIPPKFRYKAQIKLAIGWSKEQIQYEHNTTEEKIKILYAGHFLFFKGMHLGLYAFAKMVKQYPNCILTMVGQGPEEEYFHQLVSDLEITHNIQWINWVSQGELSRIYSEHHFFLFPSLRDSGGMVTLEAMAHGLPIVCLDLGGPGVLVNDSCGRVIQTSNMSEADIIRGLSAALLELARDEALRKKLGNNAVKRSEQYLWKNVVGALYSKRTP